MNTLHTRHEWYTYYITLCVERNHPFEKHWNNVGSTKEYFRSQCIAIVNQREADEMDTHKATMSTILPNVMQIANQRIDSYNDTAEAINNARMAYYAHGGHTITCEQYVKMQLISNSGIYDDMIPSDIEIKVAKLKHAHLARLGKWELPPDNIQAYDSTIYF